MKKKLLSMGISSSEILSTAEKKAVKGGYGPNPGYSNPCVNGGSVRCVNPQSPTDRYFYCDMATCSQYCGYSVMTSFGSNRDISSYCTY